MGEPEQVVPDSVVDVADEFVSEFGPEGALEYLRDRGLDDHTVAAMAYIKRRYRVGLNEVRSS
jgi:hypothetical protein